MKIKEILITIILLAFVQVAFSQPTTSGIGKLNGIIVDAETKEPIEYATISLYSQTSDKLINGGITDNKGKFTISELVDDTYKLEISFISYVTRTVADIQMEKERNVDIGDITLQTTAIEVSEVVVSGQRSLIEEKVDRTIYNAEQDDLAKGGDAADVLRKVPLLTVDLEGNVSLRGNSNISVLINNKPSTILASNISDALKMIPADQIQKVEVITSPSAKYDAEGAGGIINIITKKNNLEGYYLNLNTAAGLRGSNLSLNGSLRKGKFGMTLGGFGRAFYNKAETTMEQTTLVNGFTNFTNQFANADDNGIFGRYNLGLDYDIDNTQFLSGGIRYGVRSFSRDQLQTTEIFTDDILQQTFYRNIDGINSSNNWDVNLDYLKKLNNEGEFSISTLYSHNDMKNNFVSDNLDAEEQIMNSLKNINDNVNQELTLQTDFQSPISDNQMIEMGAKGIFRRVNSDYSYLFADSDLNYSPSLFQPSGELDYQQNVSAAYTAYTYSTDNKITIKAGLRYERTAITASQDGEDIDIPDYDNLVPSLNLSKTFNNFATLKLGYSRRIQRPWLQQLNPNVNVSNSQDIQVGNPSLKPQLSDNLELGISKMIKKTYINLSVYGRNSNNAINEVRYPIDSIAGAILTTYENIGKERALGFNLFANVNITDKWSVNGGVRGNYAILEGQIIGQDGQSQTAQNAGLNVGGRLMTQLKLNDGWSMQAFSFMRGPSVQLQGTRGGFGMYAIGLNKDFKNKKGSFGIAVENFANRGWNMRTELETPQLTQVNNNLILNRSIRVNFNYTFGQMNFKNSQRKTKSVSNDDLMSGGNNSGMTTETTSSVQNNSRNSNAAKSNKKKTKEVKATDKKVDITGKWHGTTESPMGIMEQTFTFIVTDDKLTGSVETSMGTQTFEGTIEGGKFSFAISFGQFTVVQNGTILEEDKILLQNDQGDMELSRVK